MILFDLRCRQGHAFEGWFRDGAAYEEQARLGVIACAVCGDTGVSKALMAPALATRDRGPEVARETASDRQSSSESQPGSVAESGPASPAGEPPPARAPVDAAKMVKMMRTLRQVQTHIQNNFEHVGRSFPEEARKMHLGETEKRSIYGEATATEAGELRDEGIEVAQIPWLPRHDA
jgi:hypothetical protein